MQRVRFRHLTEYQKQIICNGCGPKGLFIKVPNFLFRASCDHHDFNYWIGGNRIQRKKADLQFYKEMLVDARKWYDNHKHEKYAKLTYAYYKFWARCYYQAVRIGGVFCFHWGRQRNLYDLQKYIIEKENI